MEAEKGEAHTQKESEAEYKGEYPPANFSQSLYFWLHKTFLVYWPNALLGVVILFIGIPVAVYMNNRKGAIYGFGVGLCILSCSIIMSLAHYFAQRSSSNSSQSSPPVKPQEQTVSSTQAPIPAPQPSILRSSEQTKKEPSMHNESENKSQPTPSISQKMESSPGGQQAGRDIINNYAPPPTTLPIKQVNASSKQINSTYPDYPYGLEIILQTTVPISHHHIRLEFNAPVYNRIVNFGQGASMILNAIDYGTPANIYEFSGSANPEFSPARPMHVYVYSDKPIHLVKLEYSRE